MTPYATHLAAAPGRSCAPLALVFRQHLSACERAESEAITAANTPKRIVVKSKWTKEYKIEIQAALIQTVTRHGPLSASAVARRLTDGGFSVSKPWAGKQLQRLLIDGVVQEVGGGRYLKWAMANAGVTIQP